MMTWDVRWFIRSSLLWLVGGVLMGVAVTIAPARMALLECAREAGQLRTGGRFSMPRTQAQMASELATSRETVARALGRFREAGWIRQRGREVELLDVGALEVVVRDGL